MYCRQCGAEMERGRVAYYSPLDGEPIYTYVCPNDRWWKVFVFHTFMVGGRIVR
jgi:hypothetical protein